MLFRVIEHYADDLFENIVANKRDLHNEECFVCLSVDFDEELFPMSLESNNVYFTRECNCIGFIHKKCLDEWYEFNQKCPICRLYMEKKTTHNLACIVCRRIYDKSVDCIIICRYIMEIWLAVATLLMWWQMLQTYTMKQQ
jgi:hypothetical protein